MSQELLDVLCRNDFSVFFQRAWQEMEGGEYIHNWHIDCIAEYLELAHEGKEKRLIINIPPRTAKTLLVNVAYRAWLLGRNSKEQIISVSYSQMLSESIAYKTQMLMRTDWYKRVFPGTRLDPNQQAKRSFMTTDGGECYSTSVGGTVTGKGAGYIIIDDAVNPGEALSDVQRHNVNEWLDNTIFTRLNDYRTGRIIMIMQRLHAADPTGHLLERGTWTHVKMPAYTEVPLSFNPKNHYHYQGYLHEARLDEGILTELEESLGGYAYAGQYLQDPVPMGGGDFTEEMINYFSAARFDPHDCNMYITVDPAKSKNEGADYTAMVVWALAPDQNFYNVDGVRRRMKGVEKIDCLFKLHKKWLQLSGKPAKVGYEQVGLAEDVHYIKEHMNRIGYRFPIEELRPPARMSKEDKIRRMIPFFQDGRIWMAEDIYHKNEKGLSENLINVIVKQELLLFPRAKHDDYTDAMAMLWDMGYTFPQLRAYITSHSTYGNINMNEQINVLDM
jgi:predicted phage terminase large subunit-like protein